MARQSQILKLPYVSPDMSRRLSRSYERTIVFSTQVRDDDVPPTIIYYGAPFSLLSDAMDYMARILKNMLEGYHITREHSCRYRNGKAYHRLALDIRGLNEDCVSFRDLILMLNHHMQEKCWCNIKELPLKRLLNL